MTSQDWTYIIVLIVFATVHGYLGAWLAVRMLFRPRYPVKLFGFTVFPQGMIPRHRDRLANTIGKAVGEELVSQETVLEELFEKDFLRKKIQAIVDTFSSELLDTDHPSLIEALPSSARETVLDAISSLQYKLGEHISLVLKSHETAETINGFVSRRVDEVFNQKLSETIDDETFENLITFLEKRITTITSEPTLQNRICEFISRRVDDLASVQTPIGELFTDDAILVLKERVSEQIEPVVKQLAEIATAEKTRNQIGILIKREVHDYYENLAFFKKVFVSRDSLINEVDDLVNKTLPKKIEEVLQGEYFFQEAKSFLDASIDGILLRPLPEIIGTIEPEKLDTLKNQITNNVTKLLKSDEMQTSIASYLRKTLENVRPHSLRAILQKANPDIEPKLKKLLSTGLFEMLGRDETANVVNQVLSKQIERLLVTPIGKLSDHFPQATIKKASENITTAILTAAKEKLPDAIREFNIGNVVREKINNYPSDKLEKLVMSIAKEHLRTIELFGAFFGFIIGAVQGIIHILFK
jgi:uncharacterized membrane protein YheB (UPF0754 family)